MTDDAPETHRHRNSLKFRPELTRSSSLHQSLMKIKSTSQFLNPGNVSLVQSFSTYNTGRNEKNANRIGCVLVKLRRRALVCYFGKLIEYLSLQKTAVFLGILSKMGLREGFAKVKSFSVAKCKQKSRLHLRQGRKVLVRKSDSLSRQGHRESTEDNLKTLVILQTLSRMQSKLQSSFFHKCRVLAQHQDLQKQLHRRYVQRGLRRLQNYHKSLLFKSFTKWANLQAPNRNSKILARLVARMFSMKLEYEQFWGNCILHIRAKEGSLGRLSVIVGRRLEWGMLSLGNC